jgi:cytoskeleton protein RodZ
MTSSAAQQIGQQLRDARIGRNLSLHDVADRLKLSLRQLEWMEDGEFARLPGATFVRGFVRNYARFLELDSTPLMALLEQEYPSQPQDRAPAMPPVAAANRAAVKAWWLVLPLVAMAGVIWQQQGSGANPTAPQGELAPMLHQTASQVAASAPQMAPQASVAAAVKPVAEQAAKLASAPSNAMPVAVSPAKVTPQAASAPVAAAGQKTLRLQAQGDSWVSVVDATGKRLVYGTIAAGNSQEVRGVPPFKLKIGNAQQVALSYEGAAVALQDKTRGTTAKLELN